MNIFKATHKLVCECRFISQDIRSLSKNKSSVKDFSFEIIFLFYEDKPVFAETNSEIINEKGIK